MHPSVNIDNTEGLLPIFARLPKDWQAVLAAEKEKPYMVKLTEFLMREWETETVYPPQDQIFNALETTPFSQVKVLLLGQDPYHNPGQAHGLSFSVQPGIPIPPSLRNMYKELEQDLGIPPANHGYLMDWAQQGVLMLNAVLTVRHKQAASHKSKGWEKLTDAIIKALNAREQPLVFLLWGGFAKKKAKWIDRDKHIIIEGVHPSPLSAYGGFFGSKPFSQVNAALKTLNQEPINWRLSPLNANAPAID